MSGTKCQALVSSLSLSWGSSNLITECPAWDTNILKRKYAKYRTLFSFLRGQRGVISSHFPHLCIILSENYLGYLHYYALLVNRDPPPVSILFAGVIFMKGSGASFSTRPTSWSEHNLPPASFNENTSDWHCLLGSQCDWPSTAE